MTKLWRRVGGYIAIIGGILLIITGTNIFPPLSLFDMTEGSLLFIIGLGSGIILGGILLIMDIMEGGGVGIGCAASGFMVVLMLAIITDLSGDYHFSWWCILGPSIAILGSIIGFLQATEFKVVRDNIIEEILYSIENILLEKFNVVKIEYYGRYFGGMLFLIEFKNSQNEQKFELLSYLESTLNQKVCLASKVIPESTLLQDNMYYLFRLKHNIPKTGVREINFIREIK